MGKEIFFTTVKSNADNRKLEQDENGYYRVNLGGLNTFNSAGEFYVDDGVKDLLTNKSSALARRLKSGYLKSEVDHPQYLPGMSKAQFYARNMKIDIANTACHIRDIILTPTNEASGIPGQGNFVLIEGWIKPSGPHGEALKAALDNPDENVAFSIRSFTSDKVVNGVRMKKIMQIITFDWVLEPGISKASKWKKLSIESMDLCSMDIDEIANDNGTINECFNCSLEDGDMKDMTNEIITNFETYHNKSNSIINNW